MNNALDRLPTRVLPSQIRELAQDARELKSRQRSSGASGQASYPVANPSDWDRNERLPVTPVNEFRPLQFRITFVGDGTQSWPMVVPLFDIFFNGVSEANRAKPDAAGRRLWSSGNNKADVVDAALLDTTLLREKYKMRWVVNVYYTGNITYWLKARGQASSRGTFLVERVT